jgi:hypothetical protein
MSCGADYPGGNDWNGPACIIEGSIQCVKKEVSVTAGPSLVRTQAQAATPCRPPSVVEW